LKIRQLARSSIPLHLDSPHAIGNNVTAAMIAELGTARAAFSALKTAPRTAIAGRVGVTATLPDLFSTGNRVPRERLDKFVTLFRKTEAEFAAGYSAAWQILNRGSRASEKDTPSPAPTPTPAPTPA
jgi:hypothetical protein